MLAREPLRLGLVGCGGISRSLYVNLLTGFADRAQVVAVCDLFESMAQERSTQFQESYLKRSGEYQAQANSATAATAAHERDRLSALSAACARAAVDAPQVYTELDRFVWHEGLDAVIITTQPVMHPVAAIAAAEAGKHVFSEGPMATTLRDADAMIAAARRHQVKLSVQYATRFFRGARQAKLAVASGRLGKIVMGRVDANWYHTMAYFQRTAYRGTYAGEGGGSVFHHGRYASDLYLHLMGSPLAEVAAFMGTFLHDVEVEDASSATLRFQNGALGHVTTTTCAHENAHIPYDRVEILGEHASLQVGRTPDPNDPPFGTHYFLHITSQDKQYQQELQAFLDQEIPPQDEDMQITQMRFFLDAVRNDAPVPISGESARGHLELMAATYKSAISGQMVSLPLAPDDPFYGLEGVAPRMRSRL